MLDNIKILYHQGKQFIPNVTTAEVPGIFRGRPIISCEKVNETELETMCPLGAISANPVSIDLGKCTFCGECAMRFPNKIRFTKDYKISTNERSRLIVKEGDENPIEVNPESVRKEIQRVFGRSLKLRQVSAAGDNSCEWELNASNNVQFDLSRFGIEFVASPRHADGIAITGPISENMAEPLQICYDAVPDPKIVVLVGTDAISGGIMACSSAVNRSFLDKYPIDLYIPGNPAHPLTIINGLVSLTRKTRKTRKKK
jgi:Ni,Fe-hydrogenase III small subunit